MRKIIIILFAALFLVGCDIANDPVRLGKQSVSEAQAYAIEQESDQYSLDAEQARLTRERQDAIAVQESAIRQAELTRIGNKVLPFLGVAVVIATLGMGIGIAVFVGGNALASSVSKMAKALGELRRSAELTPGATLVLPKGLNVTVINTQLESVIKSDTEHRASRPALEANNTLRAKTAVAVQEMRGNTQFETNYIPKAEPVEARR